MLTIAGLTETVTVRGTLPALEATRNSLTRIVQRDEIDSLPVINRNFNDLAALAPGVTKRGVYGGVDISGARDFQNAYQLDGVSAERHHLVDQRIAYAQDWVQEFQVLTSQFNVEFGQAAGGVLNAITRSGAITSPGAYTVSYATTRGMQHWHWHRGRHHSTNAGWAELPAGRSSEIACSTLVESSAWTARPVISSIQRSPKQWDVSVD